MTFAIIHCNSAIAWQPKRAKFFAEGLRAQGIPYLITDAPHRLEMDGFPILLGTTFWRAIEHDDGPYLLVDRCSFGDTEKFVSLVWNGHGRRGDHKVPRTVSASRWEKHGIPLRPYHFGRRIVLCGQTEPYSPHYSTLREWYRSVPEATHFRTHPAGDNPTELPRLQEWDDVRAAVVLNSSIGVQAVMAGVPTVTMDEGAMAWDVTGHSLADIRTPDREEWCHWLAWTQWSDDEIREGLPWVYHL